MEYEYTARLNSFADSGEKGTLALLDHIAQVPGVACVELNYPQHFTDLTMDEIRKRLDRNRLRANGVALRFDSDFRNGEYGNADSGLSARALQTTLEAVDACAQLGGHIVTIWLAYDGFDYPFQIDYEKVWQREKTALREICRYAAKKEITVSFEYKPYDPRCQSMLGDIGSVLLMAEDVGESNFGVTLDYCHMRMKKEHPARSLALAASRGRLRGLHLNDGYGSTDDGLMFGSCNLLEAVEFVYYLKKYNYRGVIYFDTFPTRENPRLECAENIQIFEKICAFVERFGMQKMAALIESNDAIKMMRTLQEQLFG